jgi:hypothetical protein
MSSSPCVSFANPTDGGASRHRCAGLQQRGNLVRALESLLVRSYEDFILICVDDCSTDDSSEIVHGARSWIRDSCTSKTPTCLVSSITGAASSRLRLRDSGPSTTSAGEAITTSGVHAAVLCRWAVMDGSARPEVRRLRGAAAVVAFLRATAVKRVKRRPKQRRKALRKATWRSAYENVHEASQSRKRPKLARNNCRWRGIRHG